MSGYTSSLTASARKIERLAYTIDEFAEATTLSRAFIYEEIRAGRLKKKKFGKRSVIDAEEARRYLSEAA